MSPPYCKRGRMTKPTIASLNYEIQRLTTLREADARQLAAKDAEIERLEQQQRDDVNTIRNLEHKAEVLETDVQNMLGTIRVMADSSRRVRFRSKSVQSADIATALPYRNTDKL